jgi:hypothetical protein
MSSSYAMAKSSLTFSSSSFIYDTAAVLFPEKYPPPKYPAA